MPIRGLSPRLGNLLAKHIPFGASLFGSQAAPTISMNIDSNRLDWRAKLTLGPGARGLLSGPVMAPLTGAGGIIFPYTPTVFLQHSAAYGSTGLTHTNYDHPAFESHMIAEIMVTGEFTANSKAEADYMRACLHFLRSVSKMYFGQDSQPIAGTPPPIMRLNTHGDHILKNVPVVITAFTMELGSQVDYIATSDEKTMMPSHTTITTNLRTAYSRASTSQDFGLNEFARGGLLDKGFI